MKIVVLHNPTAGDREFSPGELTALLRRAGYRPKYFSLKDAAWRENHVLDGAEFVVVAGGDGAVRRAVLHLHDRGLPLALLPLGTANNICASLGIKGPPKTIIARWTHPRRRKIDLGVASGPWGEKFFVESAGAGLIGRAIDIMSTVGDVTDHRLDRREDRLHRDSSVVLALAHELQPLSLRASYDGGTSFKSNYLLFEAMNIKRIGPGLELAPHADASDGFFDVISATVDEREKLKRALAHGLDRENPRAFLTRRKVRALHLEVSCGEFRLDDQVIWPRPTNGRRAAKQPLVVDLSVRASAVEIYDAPALSGSTQRNR